MENQRENLSLELHKCFEHNGKTYIVEHPKETKSCHGCAFCEKDGNRCTLDNTSSDVPNCFGLNRHDGMDVIFVEAVKKTEEQTPVEKYAESIANKLYFGDGMCAELCREAYVRGFMEAAETDLSFLVW